MGKIACLCGKKDRVQYRRMKFLAERYLPYLDVYAEESVNLAKYDVAYFAHYGYAKDYVVPRGVKRLASVTSHKYDRDALKSFDGISVNNRILHTVLADLNPALTENGVDTGFWTFKESTGNKVKRAGWVGNRDRKTKNFHIIKQLRRNPPPGWEILIVATSKHDKKLKRSPEEMREFYHSLDALLVVSNDEGTPNPALEAMSCGVPVIGTPVGNLLEFARTSLVHVSPSVDSVANALLCGGKAPDKVHELCRSATRGFVENWDWSIKYKAWDEFFKPWI